MIRKDDIMRNNKLCNFEILEKYGNFLDKGIVTKSLYENIVSYNILDEDAVKYDITKTPSKEEIWQLKLDLEKCLEHDISYEKQKWFSLYFMLLLYRYGNQKDKHLSFIKTVYMFYPSNIRVSKYNQFISVMDRRVEFNKAKHYIARICRISENIISDDLLYKSIEEIDDGLYEYFQMYEKNENTYYRLFNIVPENLHMYRTQEDDLPQLVPYEFPNKY